jgi:hypothetical protein
MSFTSGLARSFELPNSSHGEMLAVLALLSILLSVFSVGLSAVRLGFTSLFFIPGAFFITLIHHCIIWYQLQSYNRRSPGRTHAPCLKHIGNILVLLVLSLLWVAGAILTMIFIIVGTPYGGRTISDVPDWISSGLACAEAMILLLVMTICWRVLPKEHYHHTR